MTHTASLGKIVIKLQRPKKHEFMNMSTPLIGSGDATDFVHVRSLWKHC
jgi:hypothetical protein